MLAASDDAVGRATSRFAFVAVTQIFNTYGPGMHPYDGPVVSSFVMQALAGDDITIYGDGSQTR